MAQNEDRRTVPLDSATPPGEVAISRKAFLAGALGVAAGVPALLAPSGAPAQGKDGPATSLARHLQSQFNEEAQVAAQYAAFAAAAKAEGLPQTAKLFQALVAAEALHAEWLLRLMDGVKSTAENLKAGADYEEYLVAKVLPIAAAQAGQEHSPKAKALFERLTAACTLHAKVLSRCRDRVVAGRDMDAQPVWVCPHCGAVLVADAPGPCPVCGTPETKFIRSA